MTDPWRDRLSEYLDGELDAEAHVGIERHLSECDECSETLAQLRDVAARAGALEDRPPERDLWPAIDARIASRSGSIARFAIAAILLIAFGAGITWAVMRQPVAAEARFLLLLHEPAGMLADHTPEQIGAVVQEYAAWAGRVAGDGQLAAAEKLADDGGRRIASDGSIATGAPVVETGGIGGFFVIHASDYAAAVAIAQSCPHIEYGGSIEVRRIENR